MKIFLNIILLLSTFALLFFGYRYFFYISDEIEQNQFDANETRKEDVTLLINGVLMIDGAENKIFADNLKPAFEVELNNFQGASINGFILDQNIFVGKGNKYEFRLPFLLQPGKNEVALVSLTDGIQAIKKYSFNLGLKELFDSDIVNSDLLVIPNTTLQNYPNSWYVSNGKLELDTISGKTHASLAFLYPFQDINLEFDFIPKGEVLNIAFYFLDSSRTIVIGNGNLRRMTLLRGDGTAIDGSDFILEKNQQYRAKIKRSGNNYQLSLSKDDEVFTTVVEYEDENVSFPKFDTVGFSAWPGSDGVTIDNLLISTND